MKPGQSIRYALWRIQYDPDWSKSRPFKVYNNGTAGLAFKNIESAMYYCDPNYLRNKWSEWK